MTSGYFLAALLWACTCFAQVSLPDLDKAGESLIAKHQLAKAEELYRDALEKARQASDQSWTAEFLRRLGEVRERSQDPKGALNWYDQALKIREELGQKPEIARLLVGSGYIKLVLNQIADGAGRIERGRALYHEVGDEEKEAHAIELLAQIDGFRGDFQKSDENFRVSLTMYEQLHRLAGIATTHGDWSTSYFRRSQYRNALSEGFAAIDAADAAAKDLPDGEDRSRLLTNQATAMDTVANTYQKMIQLPQALDYYRQALHIRQDLLHDTLSASFTQTNMAPLLVSLHRTGEAVSLAEQALAVRRAVGNKALIASTLMALGAADLAETKPQEARQKYEEALSLASERDPSRAVALYQLGLIATDGGQLDDALSFHQRALEIRKASKNPHDVVRSQIQIALVHERRGDSAKAAESYLQAIDGFEKLSLEVSDPVQLASFRETAALLYPNYARLLVNRGKFGEALLVSERGRGQALARLAGSGRAGFLESLTADERSRWDESAGRLAKAANRFRIAIEQKQSAQQLAEANAAWMEARLALNRTRERIFTANPQMQSKAPAVQPDLESLLELSRRAPDTLYLEWLAVDNDSTLLFSLSAGDVKAYSLTAGIDELRTLVSDWRNSLILGDGRGFKNPERVSVPRTPEPELARNLYRAALGPVAVLLESAKWRRLVAVPDGPLLDAPLAALIANNGKRLVETHAIASAVSLHSLASKSASPAAHASLLVIGDPSEGKSRAVIPSGARLEPLAHAQEEAKAIAAEFPGAVDPVGADAHEAQVKRRMDCCSILHFATHGILDSENGMDSGLLLAAEPADSIEDGVLQAWEIAEMRLNAKLAVLSACDSARGDQTLGEGLVGLAWAFQAAGTPTVVASLWSVDDAATAELMRAFYAALKKGARTDDAMQRAMLQLQKQASSHSPYFWAPFAVIGQSERVQ